MELGATVCTPKSPQCSECPVSRWCKAHKLGIAAEVPEGRRKRATVKVTLAAAVLLDPQGQTLLLRQTGDDGVLFSHLWQFPAVETPGPASTELARYLLKKFAITMNGSVTPLKTARHVVTFRNIQIKPFLICVERLPHFEGARTTRLNRLSDLPISNLTRKIAAAALAAVAKSLSSVDGN